jgi:predicted amidophosphoribosyltransferase
MSLFPSFLLPAHSQADFNKLRGDPPNRICFSTTHSNALKDNSSSFAGSTPFKFHVPFREGVVHEFYLTTDIQLRKSQYGYWVPLTDEQAKVVKTWMADQGTRVYLKDLFDCSVALGERTVSNKETELGELFTAAKYEHSEKAALELSTRVAATLSSLKSLSSMGCVSCPPPRAGKEFDLPTFIATRVAKKTGLPFIDLGNWKTNKGQLKDVAADKKWAVLDAVGFDVNPKLSAIKGATLVIDDIYQSGTTLNFLRSKLTASGIPRASAVSIVKAARDTDNQ